MKKIFASIALAGFLATGAFAEPNKPKSIIHIVNVKFKDTASKADIDKAIEATGKINHPGLKNVWLKTIKNQLGPNLTHTLVMEFESEAAFKSYTDSPAQKKWYEVYLPLRQESRTNDVTN